MDSKEKDWKLYKKNIGAWQERYIDKILEEYKEIIDRKEVASKRFWNLYHRIKDDLENPGVLIASASRNNLKDIILSLYSHNVITFEELNDFSDEIKDYIKLVMNIK
jgi:hypothetical protein